MNKKVTTYDISSALGVSRNTVSKVLNNHPGISEKTRTMVINCAREMGYKKTIPEMESPQSPRSAKNIAILSRIEVNTNGYWMHLMSGVEDVLRKSGYDMKMAFIKDDDIISMLMPPMMNGEIDGFIVLGTVDKIYTEKLVTLPLPKVFVDISTEVPLTDLQTDLVLMESEESVYRITIHLIESRHRDIGFIGHTGSRSMFERWKGYSRALYERNIPMNPIYNMIAPHPSSYQTYDGVAETLDALKRLPTALVCANDLTALHAIRFVKDKGLRVPDDISISGFDRIRDAMLLDISLTTVENNQHQLGIRAAESLLYRIQHPDRPFEVIRLVTRVMIGASTGVNRARE